MSLYLACYDIPHTRRRRRVARCLEGFGRRVQQSVFEVWLEPRDLPRLRLAVGCLLAKVDEFAIYPVDDRGNRRRVRWQRPPTDYGPALVLGPSDADCGWPPANSREWTDADWDTPAAEDS